ncbi:MAG: tRNA 2-thiocytidine(32) synthetase TtcA [Pseudomonadota bacterium]
MENTVTTSKAADPRKSSFNMNRMQKTLRGDVGRAIADYNMIQDGDLVMVCLSGGKDSYVMLDILLNLQKHAPIDFRIKAVNLDQKQPGFPEHVLPTYLESIGVDYHIIEQDTYSIVIDKTEPGKTYCGLCSRLRRGNLYSYAESIGATKIALGHHRHDMMETLFLNMFFGGKLKSMPPKLLSDDGKHIVIRPLAYCKEKDIAAFAKMREFPIIPCNLCGAQENMQRKEIKKMLNEWERNYPGRLDVMFKSLLNVAPSHLGDTGLFDFKSLEQKRKIASEQPQFERIDVVNLG